MEVKMCIRDRIVKTGKMINKLIIDGDNFYVIIMKAYTKASKETGMKYICRMKGTKLSVSVKGTIVEDVYKRQEEVIMSQRIMLKGDLLYKLLIFRK